MDRADDGLPIPGERYVWESPGINFGPVFMEVAAPRRRKPGHVHLRCIGPNGEPYLRLKLQKLPLPLYFKPYPWTENDVRESQERLLKRQCARNVETTNATKS